MTIVASPRLQQDVFSWEELSELHSAEPLFDVADASTEDNRSSFVNDPVAFSDEDEEYEDEEYEDDEEDEEDEEYEDEEYEDDEEGEEDDDEEDDDEEEDEGEPKGSP